MVKMQEGLDFIHGQHKAGKPVYAQRLTEELYRRSSGMSKPYSKTNLAINDMPLQESYIIGGEIESPVLGVASLGEILSRFIKTSPKNVKAENWRAYEPQAIDYVLRKFRGVDRLFVNHHSAEILNGEYAQGLTDENTLTLWEEFGKKGLTTFHFVLQSDNEDIRKRLTLAGDSEKTRYPAGMSRDLQEKIDYSKRMFSLIPGNKKFNIVMSVFPMLYEINPDIYKNAGIEKPFIFVSQDKDLPPETRLL